MRTRELVLGKKKKKRKKGRGESWQNRVPGLEAVDRGKRDGGMVERTKPAWEPLERFGRMRTQRVNGSWLCELINKS